MPIELDGGPSVKLSLVEPFVSRPAPENQAQSEEVEGFQPIKIKKINAEIGSESNSEADEKSKYRRYLEFMDYLSKHKDYKKPNAELNDKAKSQALFKYEKIKDFQGPFDLMGNRLDSWA